jgi:eukaryotic-like serine/threonine-protein kinase
MNERDIFVGALELESQAQRAAYLDTACAGDAAMRERVEALLAEHEKDDSFLLDSPPPGVDGTRAMPPLTEQPGQVIGPYKLLEQIGEGGMGVVFMAEQQAPVRRKVALKVTKPGMDTRQVIARFEAERQALAVMDHPSIARVLDAGSTESGRPYFVMELVRGVPITTYCDENNLPVRERLELFASVCQAIQHAHTKGIIHRDIKPTNVLVTRQDGRAVVKVIDFGIAKAMGQQLTEKTLFTNFDQMIGTPLYMSPEQAEKSGVDIDTRSDIYSLGVLLYELLTGSTPVDAEQMKQAAFDEVRRIIREEEPPTPSARISGSRTLPAIAAHRHIEPARLSKLLRGELDWVVMKALEKDRSRRYETASGFAADIERHLHDEPVEACPPSARYRLGKFVRRNKATLAIAVLVLLFLTMLGGGAGWAARDRSARQARAAGQLELILGDVTRLEQSEKWSEALASARRAEPALAAGEAAPEIQERARQALDDLELIQRLEETRMWSGTAWADAQARKQLSVQAERAYAATFREAGIDIDMLPAEEAAKQITARGRIAAAVLPALDDWVAVRSVGKDEAAIRRLIDVLQTADRDPWRQQIRDALLRKDWLALESLVKSPDLDRQPAATLSFLSAAFRENGKFLDEEFVLRQAQWKYPGDYWINIRLGTNLIYGDRPNDIRDGIGYMRAAVALRPQNAHPVMILGLGYKNLGQNEQAIACFRKAIELHPNYWASYNNLGNALGLQGLHDKAVAALEQAIKLATSDDSHQDDLWSPIERLAWLLANSSDAVRREPNKAIEMAKRAIELSPNNGGCWNTLGTAEYRAGDWRAAIDALKKSEELPGHRNTGGLNALFLVMAHWQLGEQDEAQQWYGKAVEWIEKHQTEDQIIRRFRTEAEELLKITDQKPTTKSETK